MFWHRLALTLGMTVKDAMTNIDNREFAYWMAYDRISPIGAERNDALVALLRYSIIQPNLDKSSSISPTDFIPDWGKSEGLSKIDDQEAKFEQFANKVNGM